VGDEWEWIPNGLVFNLTKKIDAPALDTVILKNAVLWTSFQDPTKGLLSRYNHLFLTNVLDEYAISSIEYGKYLILSKRFDDAKKQLERAKAYGSDSQTVVAWMYLGLAESLEKNCEKALIAYDHAKQPEYPPNAALTYYEALTYRDCVGDQKRATELFSQYDASTRQTEQPLDIPR
jgi:tetratricopeptide (TPR) repeat protein